MKLRSTVIALVLAATGAVAAPATSAFAGGPGPDFPQCGGVMLDHSIVSIDSHLPYEQHKIWVLGLILDGQQAGLQVEDRGSYLYVTGPYRTVLSVYRYRWGVTSIELDQWMCPQAR